MNKGNCAFLKCFAFCMSCVLNSANTWGQSTWNPSDPGKDFFSGIPIACCDLNGDTEDDLIVLDQAKHLWIGTNLGNGTFLWKATNYHQFSAVWSVNIADLDKNGFTDILLSGEGTKLQIMYQNEAGFELRNADENSFFSQAASLSDINKDGWLDFTLCDDNRATHIYVNDGSGNLIRDTSLISLSFANPLHESGNYGCIWTDMDNDGDQDLYISKCRPGVDDPTDPRRVNLLYINENGHWSEQGKKYGLDLGDQSWITLFEDFDGDGLKDCFVINHYTPSRLFRQKADHLFEDVTATCGIDFPGICIQALPADFDNDGDLDILMSGFGSALWINDGGMKFSEQKGPLTSSGLSTCAIGDLNSDGHIDVYGGYANLLNAPNNQRDKLWLNPGNANHFILCALRGIQSNREGVSTRIELYSGGHLQARELHGGEAFGIQNSYNVHFGLGASSEIDSLVVHWPSGQVDRFYQLPADQKYLITEGTCIQPIQRKTGGVLRNFCNGIDTILSVESTARNWTWNTGSTKASIRVQSEAVYFYRAVDSLGCPWISQPIAILLNPKSRYLLNHSFHENICEGEFLDLAVQGIDKIKWSTGQTDSILHVEQGGMYFGQVKGFCDLIYTDTLTVETFPLPEPPKVEPDTLFGRGRAHFTSNVDASYWFNLKEDEIPLHVGKDFLTDTIEASRSFWVESRSKNAYPFVHGGMKKPDYSDGPYHAKFLNNQTLFNVYKDVILDSVTLYTDDPGLRTIELLDNTGVRLSHRDVNLQKGKNQVYLGFEIPASDKVYFLTTNLEKNQQLFGENSPRLYRSNQGFYYPFFVEDKVRILSSDKGDSYYYYFFDWVLRAADKVCISPRQEVRVEILPVRTNDVNHPAKYWLTQNETGFQILSDGINPLQMELKNYEGKTILRKTIASGDWVNTQDIPSGFYVLELHSQQDRRIILKYAK